MNPDFISMMLAIGGSILTGLGTDFVRKAYKKFVSSRSSSNKLSSTQTSSSETLVAQYSSMLVSLKSSSLNFVSIIIALIGIASGIITFFNVSISSSPLPEDLSIRIKTISKQLIDSAEDLSKVQRELEQRMEIVDQMKKEAESAEAMINMSKEQVNAIRTILGDEIDKNDVKNFWVSFLQNVLFLILGSMITFLTPKIVILYKNRKRATNS